MRGVSELSPEQIYQEIGKIVSEFSLYECDDCARTIMHWLAENGIEGKIIKMKTKYDEDFILSDRMEIKGITQSITVNGKHYGVEVLGLVFDNLSATGMTLEDWRNDFHCPSEEFIIETLDSL